MNSDRNKKENRKALKIFIPIIICCGLIGGLIGYFAYDMVRYFEKTLAEPPADDLNMPDADMHLFDERVNRHSRQPRILQIRSQRC